MIINYNDNILRLPDFLIVGAAKSGTTALHYYLKQHPKIFMPKQKELWLFSFLDLDPTEAVMPKKAVYRLDDYANHFKEAREDQILGEACPIYLYAYEDSIRNIKKVYGEDYSALKIIIILRNPAERTWSHFMMNKRDGSEYLKDITDFLKTNDNLRSKNLFRRGIFAADYIGFGMYYKQVKYYMDEFDKVKIFLYEDLCKDALEVTKEIFRFIGVDYSFVPDTETKYNISGHIRFKSLNALIHRKCWLKGFLKLLLPFDIRAIKFKVSAKNIQKQEMPIGIKRELIKRYYEDDIRKLQTLIKRDLSSWGRV